VVRHETDGYIDDALGRAAVQKQAKTTDFLPELLDSAPASKHTFNITVQRKGKEVYCSSIPEAKTRAVVRAWR
jgi:hypothetical protein